MTIKEFKAWLEGYTEDMKGSPTKKQWNRIQERLGEVNDQQTVYHYYPNWYPAWWGYGTICSGGSITVNDSLKGTTAELSSVGVEASSDTSAEVAVTYTAMEIGKQEFARDNA